MKLLLYSLCKLLYPFKFLQFITSPSPTKEVLTSLAGRGKDIAGVTSGTCLIQFPCLMLVAFQGSWNFNNVESNQVGEVLSFSVSWGLDVCLQFTTISSVSVTFFHNGSTRPVHGQHFLFPFPYSILILSSSDFLE